MLEHYHLELTRRGLWSTSSTEGTGSGCSAYEPKPSWQKDTG